MKQEDVIQLGIYSAANAMDLDFVEVTNEDYDFLINETMMEDERIIEFIKILKSDKFRKRVKVLGGYNFKRTGEIIKVNNN